MAVYTEPTDDELDAFVAQYDIGSVRSCKGIAEGVENSNFLLTTSRDSFILTLYEKRVDPEELPFFLNLKVHLAAQGIPCPLPVAARDGKALRSLAGRPAALVTYLDGRWPKRITADHCTQLGAAMARMHLAGADFPMRRANNLSVSGWRPLFALCDGKADTVSPGLAQDLTVELTYLEEHWPQDLPCGVIHADLFPDNVFFLDGTLSGLIDFYFACTDFLAYDVAVCLNAWCFEHQSEFNVTKAQQLLHGYQSIRPLQPSELTQLPLLARGAAMRFLLTRLYDWLNTPADAFVKPKDPMEYVRKLRFHRQAESVSAYGLTPASGV